MALDYGYITSVVQEHYMPGFADNVYDKSALLKIMQMDNAITLKGGDGFSMGLKYGKNQAHGTFSGYDTLDVSPSDNRTRAKYEWANYYSSVSVSGDDEDVVSGPEAVLDLVEDGMKDAEMTLRDDLADDLYSGSAAMVGLSTAIGTGTYAGIAGGTYTWWQSGVDSTAHTSANMVDSTSTSYVLTLLQSAIRSATHLGSRPNLIVTNLFVWDVLERVLNAQVQYAKNVTGRTALIGQAGFNTLEFRGIPIVADEKCPDSKMYVLNTEFLKLVVHQNRNFKFTGFKEPTNQIARVGQITHKCQLALSNRRMFYAFTNLPTS